MIANIQDENIKNLIKDQRCLTATDYNLYQMSVCLLRCGYFEEQAKDSDMMNS